jgi:acetyl-CoA carboxylase biotin carboxyl carrier protein
MRIAGVAAALPAAGGEPAVAEDRVEAAEDTLHYIVSPIVGTFYRAASPESDPFVSPGDRVEKNKILCIIEAMKLMNEIESDVAGEVVKVFPQNGQPVEYGEKLFAIKTS